MDSIQCSAVLTRYWDDTECGFSLSLSFDTGNPTNLSLNSEANRQLNWGSIGGSIDDLCYCHLDFCGDKSR